MFILTLGLESVAGNERTLMPNFEICWSCKGTGLYYTGESVVGCYECKGWQVTYLRDDKGRFIKKDIL